MFCVWKSVRLGLLALSACAGAGDAAAGLLPPGDHNRIVRSFDQRPMVFFVAHGPADACGKGCNEWIAAVGIFDDGAAQRFRSLTDKLGGRNLPVFFHSPGGSTGAGVKIGIILRERRMTAGVGRTDATCRIFDQKDKACQLKILTGAAVSARLTTSDAACFSACVEAFAGASFRRVAAAAYLGVHAARLNLTQKEMQLIFSQTKDHPRVATMGDFRQAARRYYVEMGVSPELPDFASKIPHNRIYVLNRAEIARFGVESQSDSYATPWTTSQMPGLAFAVVRSVTKHAASNPAENLTTRLAFICSPDGKPVITYRRDLAREPDHATTFTRLAFDQWSVDLTVIRTVAEEEMGAFAAALQQEMLTKFAAAKTVIFTEKTKAGAQKVLETKFSNAGLAEALAELQKRCVPSVSLTNPIGTETLKPIPVKPVPVKAGVPARMPDAMPKQ